MSIASAVTSLGLAKENIRSAITAKGGSAATGGFSSFPEAIASIPSGSAATGPDSFFPEQWKYFLELKTLECDQAILLSKSAWKDLALKDTGECMYTLYGGESGKELLVSTRVPANVQWLLSSLNTEKYAQPYYYSLDDFTGKSIVNDPIIGTTELITLIIHRLDGSPAGAELPMVFARGMGYTLYLPIVAYSSYSSLCVCEQMNQYNLKFAHIFGNSVIPTHAFSNSFSLHAVKLPANVSFSGVNNFYMCRNLFSLGNTELNNLTAHMFDGCYGLTDVRLADSVTSIPLYCFNSCLLLNNINIPSGLTELGDFSFSGCTMLKTVTLPATLTSIGNNAFQRCMGLYYIRFQSTVPPALSNIGVFAYGNAFCKLLIPYDSVSAYKTATNWSSTTNSIVTMQRGYGTFSTGDALPAFSSDGNYALTWFETLPMVLSTMPQYAPAVEKSVNSAQHDGEYYCTFAAVE